MKAYVLIDYSDWEWYVTHLSKMLKAECSSARQQKLEGAKFSMP
jgi:hypothetical protein